MSAEPVPVAKPEEPWYLQPLMWLFLLLFGAIILMLLIGLVSWGWVSDTGTPAWIQAIGSLVGIAIAISVPAWQHKIKERTNTADRTRADLRTLEALRTIFHEAGEIAQEGAHFSSVDPQRNSGGERTARAQRLAQLQAELSGILLTDMPDAMMVKTLADGRRHMAKLQEIFGRERPDAEPPLGTNETISLGSMGEWLSTQARVIAKRMAMLERQAR